MIFGKVYLGDGVLEFKGAVGDVEQLVKTFSSEVQRGSVGEVPSRRWRYDGSLREGRARLCGASEDIFVGEDSVGDVSSDVENEAIVAAGRLSRSVAGRDEVDRGDVSGAVRGDAQGDGGQVIEGEVCGVPKVGKWRKKNLRKKQKKMERDSANEEKRADEDVGTGFVASMKSEARQTLEAKWVVENKLAKLKAEQELEIVARRDLMKEAKKREVETMRRTESAKVAVEKSFATLRKTGNVVGHCETVVSGVPGLSDGSSSEGECTISPDSSVSRAEVQEMQKQLLDLEKELADARKLIKRREIMDKATYAQSVAEFTAGSESGLSDGLKGELDRKFGESYEYDGKCDGKHVVRRVFDVDVIGDEGCDDLEDIY